MVHGRVSLLEIELKVKACFVKQCTFVNIRCRTQGVKHYDAAVVTQLLEFLYRYTSDVLECAQVHPIECCTMSICTWHACTCNCPLRSCHKDAKQSALSSVDQ